MKNVYRISWAQLEKELGGLILANDLAELVKENDENFDEQVTYASVKFVDENGKYYSSWVDVPENLDFEVDENEIFQYYLISDWGVEFIREYCPDITLLTSEKYDATFLPVYFFGISWEDVYTNCTIDLSAKYSSK